MKFFLTNYDVSEYQIFEQRLNELSKQGYNSNDIDRFTIFKKDNQRYYYHTDIFIPDKSKQENNHSLLNKWLLVKVDQGYEYIGKSGKIYVFRADKPLDFHGTDKKLIAMYFKRNKSLSNFFFLFIAMLLTVGLVPGVFTNLHPNEFITNGMIILHFTPLILCLSLLSRFFYHHLLTERIKQQLINKRVYQSKIKPNNIIRINNWLFIITIVLVIIGFGFDYFERKTVPVTNDIISLKTFDLAGNQEKYNTCMKTSSFLIKETISYSQSNDHQSLNVTYYRYHDSQTARQALTNYLNSSNYQNHTAIEQGYLLSNDNIYTTMAFYHDDQLIVIQTTFDLLNDNIYQKAISAVN